MNATFVESDYRPAAKTALVWWTIVTAACLMQLVATFALAGKDGLKVIIQEGPISVLPHTLLAVGLTWALVGATLAFLAWKRRTATTIFTLLCFLCIAFVYVNVMRERTRYGDVGVYIEAAESLHSGTPWPRRYLYPPLWAALVAPLTPFGAANITAAYWFLNLLALFGLFVLLRHALVRYGFSLTLATLISFLFCLVNVPILRSLLYVQVNLHITNLILGCILLYPRYRFLSALSLSLAVNIKMSPVILVLPFLYVRDFRWMLSFAASLVSVALLPALAYGWTPFFDFVSNISDVAGSNVLSYRENSIESLMEAIALITGIERAGSIHVIRLLRLLVGSAAVAVAIVSVRRSAFVRQGTDAAVVLNAMPAVLVMMVLVSPILWEHHGILMGLSFLVLLTRVSTPHEWLLFGTAYYLQYLVPTFDFFPWSYGRLVSGLIWLWLAWSTSSRDASEVFARVNRWTVARLPVALASLSEPADSQPQNL